MGAELLRVDRQTDLHDGAKIGFSQFFECALKRRSELLTIARLLEDEYFNTMRDVFSLIPNQSTPLAAPRHD